VCNTSVCYGTGRGGAGFHSPGPALRWGRGIYLWSSPPNPRLGPNPGYSLDGSPFFSLPILGRDLPGAWVGRGPWRGDRRGMEEKTPLPAPPRPDERSPAFLGYRRTRNELYMCRLAVSTEEGTKLRGIQLVMANLVLL